jgi:carbamoyltransferase
VFLLGIHPGYHDACAALYEDYRLVAAVAQERLTRRKIDGGRIPTEAIDECLTIAGITRRDVDAVALSRGAFPARYFTHFSIGRRLERGARRLLGKEKMKSMERECVRALRFDSEAMLNIAQLREDLGLRPDSAVRFFNHHWAHALPTLFHTDWSEALLYTADGGGDNIQYSFTVFRDGKLTPLYGGDGELARPMPIDSIGLAYGYATQALGWRINRHEGKLTGLAALGKPAAYDALAPHFRIGSDGRVASDFGDNKAMRDFVFGVAKGVSREDMAASVQLLLEHTVLASVQAILRQHPVRHLGLAGGVFANVLLNQKLAALPGVDEVFVYPAMSDQGLAAGGVLQLLLERDGLSHWLKQRHRLADLYLGRDYDGMVEQSFTADGRLERVSSTPADTVPRLIAEGWAVGLYVGAMEYGPRALGARTILASPADPGINDRLNRRLERSEFMPFAPVVAAVDASRVFEIDERSRYAARFMTITCPVRAEWRTKIPAVVHVDGTARPQIVERAPNPLYFDILAGFKAHTGLPVLINTSFNVHEEPIINTPAECAQALATDRVDFVATAEAVWRRRR